MRFWILFYIFVFLDFWTLLQKGKWVITASLLDMGVEVQVAHLSPLIPELGGHPYYAGQIWKFWLPTKPILITFLPGKSRSVFSQLSTLLRGSESPDSPLVPSRTTLRREGESCLIPTRGNEKSVSHVASSDTSVVGDRQGGWGAL